MDLAPHHEASCQQWPHREHCQQWPHREHSPHSPCLWPQHSPRRSPLSPALFLVPRPAGRSAPARSRGCRPSSVGDCTSPPSHLFSTSPPACQIWSEMSGSYGFVAGHGQQPVRHSQASAVFHPEASAVLPRGFVELPPLKTAHCPTLFCLLDPSGYLVIQQLPLTSVSSCSGPATPR